MAKFYDKKKKDLVWSDCDISCVVEDAYWELSDFLAIKKLDGHNINDQWYMAVHRKLGELIDILGESPIDELDENMKPLN